MPSIAVSGGKLENGVRDKIAADITSDLISLINASAVQVYFNEYDTIHFNGTPDTGNVIFITVNGPAIEKDALAEMCSAVTLSVRNAAQNPDFRVAFVCQPSDKTTPDQTECFCQCESEPGEQDRVLFKGLTCSWLHFLFLSW